VIAVGSFETRMLGVLTAGVLLVALAGASPAPAAAPWWHLRSGTRPASIQPGSGRDEVQEITATPEEIGPGETAVAFELGVEGGAAGVFVTEPYAAILGLPEPTAPNVQKALEALYGKGNVIVTGGPAGTVPLIVTSVGGRADQPVSPLEVHEVGIGAASGRVVTEGQPDGQVYVTASNLGDANADDGGTAPITLADKLPAGLKAVSIEGLAGQAGGFEGEVECSLASLTCTLAHHHLTPYREIEARVDVVVEHEPAPGEENEVTISGGEAQGTSIRRLLRIGDTPAQFGVENYELSSEEEGGAPATQAGSHPFQLTTTIALNQTLGEEPVALTKDLNFKLPPGLIGNPIVLPRCRLADFLNEACPPDTAIGVATPVINEEARGIGVPKITVPLFNLEPAIGEPARFGFLPTNITPVFIDTSVRTGGDYGITSSVDNIEQVSGFLSSEVTIWGAPGDPRHDISRGYACLNQQPSCKPQQEVHPPPFLSLPTSCTGPLTTSVETDSWTQPGDFQSFPSREPMSEMDGCNRLPFSPSISVAPDGQAASKPSGLTVDVHVPQEESLNGAGLSESDVRDTTVALPPGVTIDPAGADGLEACSEAEIGYLPGQSSPPRELRFTSGLPAPKGAPAEPFCPNASKIGTVKIKLPILENPLEGSVYLATQNTNPFGSLVAIYIVAEEPISGVLVKLPGEVSLDRVTGQIVTTLLNTPQAPFEDAELHFFGEDRAPLATPAHCGTYTTTASIAPWSGNEAGQPSSSFQIVSGPDGTACQNPLQFAPSLTAGTTSIQAGGFSPFTMTMSREDGQQNLQAISLRMPPGLSGLLSSVKLCGEPQADLGTCGKESEIGETVVSVGLGSNPFSVRGGKVFITEGYEGAPYGLSIVNPAKAGPFDLGQVVVRAKIEVDPTTAALTITTDNSGPYKIPSILDGIPLEIKHVNVTIDRPGFTFNPTNCNPMRITGSLSSTEGATSALSVPLQVTNCAVLGFKPGFSVSTSGKTSRANGASLHVKLTYPRAPFGSQANIAKVKVDLPKQLPSRLTTLQKACPDKTFDQNPALCSPESRVGQAMALTPLLPVPLSGPAYFVSHGGAKFPELIIVLSGYGTTIQLRAETFINKAGITSSTFRTVPDAPVGSFELTLPQGKYSALAANGNLCKSTLKMPTAFTAQNGAVIHKNTPISVTGCPKAKAKRAHKAGKRHKTAHRAKRG
jgi:hypothetical protein